MRHSVHCGAEASDARTHVKQLDKPQLHGAPVSMVNPLLHCVYTTSSGVVVVDVLKNDDEVVLVEAVVVESASGARQTRPKRLLPKGSRSLNDEQSSKQAPSARYFAFVHSAHVESSGPLPPGGREQLKQLGEQVHGSCVDWIRLLKHCSCASVVVVFGIVVVVVVVV